MKQTRTVVFKQTFDKQRLLECLVNNVGITKIMALDPF